MAMPIDPLDPRTPVAGFNGGVFVHRDMPVIEQCRITPAQSPRSPSQPYRLDVTHPGANKVSFAQYLSAQYEIGSGQIATIGDPDPRQHGHRSNSTAAPSTSEPSGILVA
jgi:hypothetical protein